LDKNKEGKNMQFKKSYSIVTLLLLSVFVFSAGSAHAQAKLPNILVIMGDDIGWFNISAYNRGMMGYRTPNIDRIANEGAMFTDYYGQQSCTAGRAAFITGQNPIRTGLTKVGFPGADLGLRPEDPTIAELLKSLGYATGQFGKNHLGDKDHNISNMVSQGYSWRSIQSEIGKCIPLCCNCHRLEHWSD
jgi:arylsulfatase